MRHFGFLFLALLFACSPETQTKPAGTPTPQTIEQASLVILGNLQDAGSPHIACRKKCCEHLFGQPDPNRMVVSLGLIDPLSEKTWLFEATPNIPRQLKKLKNISGFKQDETPDGVFLTHAHMGHYAGLMYLGREAMSADSIPVYTMPKMKAFLSSNGPWDQLVTLGNVDLKAIQNNVPVSLNNNLSVTPIQVPHRDEYSETVGYHIIGPNKSALFIPDIDKWSQWKQSIVDWVARVDYALLDATFFDAEEINNRDIAEIPHPFVIESMETFADLSPEEKAKIHFIHFNHTNPLLVDTSQQYREVIKKGFQVAQLGQILEL